MTNLTFNDNPITQREDNYVNATEMCKANNFRIDNWITSEVTRKYLKALQESVSLNLSVTVPELVKVVSSGFPAKKSTWLHPLAAIHLAQSISPEFHVWCNTHIKTLMETGKTEIATPEPLPPSRDYVESIQAAKDLHSLRGSIPAAIYQALMDKMGDELTSNLKQLPKSTERWIGCSQRAEELGFNLTTSDRIKLGQYISKAGLERCKEERLCNGQLRGIWVYLVDKSLDAEIREFFN